MKASLLDLRRNLGKILAAIDRNETITITRRGEIIARIVPECDAAPHASIMDDPAVGMWKDRDDMSDPVEYVRRARRSRFHDL